MTDTKRETTLLAMALEVWRLETRLTAVESKLGPAQAKLLHASVRRMFELLSDVGFTIEDPTGRPYVEGERIEVLVFEPTVDLQRSTIIETVKPAIYRDSKLAAAAEVIVGVPAGATATE